MLRLARFRGLAVVVFGLLIWSAILDVALTATVGFTGRWLPNAEAPTDSLILRETGSRIAGLLALPERPGIGTHTPFGILLGHSTLGAGIDSTILEEVDGLPTRWLNLHGWGTSITSIQDVAELVFVSGARPDVLVLAINPLMLVGSDFPTDHAFIMAKEGKRLKPWIWVYNNRYVVNHGARMLLHRAKLRLSEAFGFAFPALFRALPDPWKSRGRERMAPESAAEQAYRLEHAQRLGWFDAARYSPDSPNSRALVDMIQQGRARGAQVCIILMPEHSLLRARIPAQAVRCFAEINRLHFPDDPVPVYDLRDRIPDDLFRDLQHASLDAGRPIALLAAQCLRDLLSGDPAPERLRAQTGGGGKPAATPHHPEGEDLRTP